MVRAREVAQEEPSGYSTLQFIADTCTLLRIAIACFIISLGLFSGPYAIRAAVIAVFVGWVTDIVDGPIARNSGSASTWVAKLDVPADLGLVLSFYLFLVLTGLFPVLPALLILAACGVILLLRPTYAAVQIVSAPFFALPIVLSFLAGWLIGTIFVVFIVALGIFRWDRLTGYAREAKAEAAGTAEPD